MLRSECVGRLTNWKFGRAKEHLTDEADEAEREIVELLARMFADSGWFDGDMGTLVEFVVLKLCDPYDDQ